EKVFRHLGDLLIGEARVGLSNVEEALPIADRERVIGEDTAAFSVAPLDRGDHYIERSEGPFHLQPFHSATARPIRRPRIFDHETLVAPFARRRELALEDRDKRFAC